MKRIVPIVLAVWAALFVPSQARAAADTQAGNGKDVKRIENMTRVALEDYDLGDYEAARKGLEGALEQIKTAKLDAHPVAATAHLYLAAVYGVGLKDANKGVAEMRAALSIDPKVALPPLLQKPEVQKLVDQAKAPAEAPKPAPPADTGPVVGIVHAPVDTANEGTDITIDVKIGADLKAKDVTLYFRPTGAQKWLIAPMKKTTGEGYGAVIPASATSVDALQYYIDVKNLKKKIVASKGNAGTPFTISIVRIKKAEEPAQDPANDDDEENPLKKYR